MKAALGHYQDAPCRGQLDGGAKPSHTSAYNQEISVEFCGEGCDIHMVQRSCSGLTALTAVRGEASCRRNTGALQTDRDRASGRGSVRGQHRFEDLVGNCFNGGGRVGKKQGARLIALTDGLQSIEVLRDQH